LGIGVSLVEIRVVFLREGLVGLPDGDVVGGGVQFEYGIGVEGLEALQIASLGDADGE
jgi:hypothetical protein